MNEKEQQAAIQEGKVLIRKKNKPAPVILYRSKYSPEWTTLVGNFPDRSARDHKFEELLNKPSIITF